MELKKNYFFDNMVECNIDSVADYFSSAKYNYVILIDGKPIMRNGIPYIYGGREDYENEIENFNGFDELGFLKDNFQVMTEFDFLMDYCFDFIIDYIKDIIKKENFFDGVCYIHHMNYAIQYNDAQILAAYVDNDERHNGLAFLMVDIEDEKDERQYFMTIDDFDRKTISDILDDIFEDIK